MTVSNFNHLCNSLYTPQYRSLLHSRRCHRRWATRGSVVTDLLVVWRLEML